MYLQSIPVPECNKIRVLISTDAANEADDQLAIVYALLSKKLTIVGLVASHFCMACKAWNSPHYNSDPLAGERTMAASYAEILRVLDRMEQKDAYPVLQGATHNLADAYTPNDSEGARFIIEQAHQDGAPLYVLVLGAATDIASAYLLDPSIADGIEQIVWVGGGNFPDGGIEFNLENDIAAANVLADSELKLTLIPPHVSNKLRVSFSELLCRVRPCGAIGKYLCEKTFAFSSRAFAAENWVMWDIAGVAALLEPAVFSSHRCNAPHYCDDLTLQRTARQHEITVCDDMDIRYVFEDFYAKLSLAYGASAINQQERQK